MSMPQQSVGASLIRRLSARGAIMGQVLSFCLLMLPIVGYSMWAEWNYEKTTQRSQLLHTVKALAARQTALTRGSESRLKALSFTPIIQRGDPEEVFPFLVLFNQLEEDYVGVALFRPDGSSVAGVLNGKTHVVPAETIRKQQYFIQALARRGFSVGNSLTMNDGGSILPMTMPVLDQSGEPRFILLLPLGIDQQHKALDTFLEENGGNVVLFDGDRRLLFEHPEAVGKAFSKEYVERELYPQAFRHTEGKPGESVFSFQGPEGEALVGAMTFLYQGNEERPYISILAFDNQLTWAAFLGKGHILQLIGLSIITFLLLYTSNRLGSLCFADGLGHMAGVALKVGEGDAAVRSGSVVGCREIVILGRALDGMLDALQKSAHKLRALSMHDPLTGLWNRRQFTEMALREIRVSGRYGHRLALGMADIDHFKTINDTYGHAAGDAVLRGLSQIIRKNVRKSDMVARFGGEEFIFLFPHTTLEEASGVLEALRRTCEETAVPYLDGTIRFTASFGAASFDPGGDELPEAMLDTLIRHADEALYVSKEKGRNRVSTYRDADKA